MAGGSGSGAYALAMGAAFRGDSLFNLKRYEPTPSLREGAMSLILSVLVTAALSPVGQQSFARQSCFETAFPYFMGHVE